MGATHVPMVEDLPPRHRLSLRVREGGRGAVGAALGLDLPERVGERARGGGREALCLGPDEWLIEAEEADAAALARALGGVDVSHAAVDISDREVGFRVSGPGTLALLAMGCPRDVARIAPGRGARTIFHGASVVIRREAEEEVRIDIWRSVAPHVRALMETGLKELRAGL